MKHLICAADIEALKQAGKTVCEAGPDVIITPSARDAAEALGITFSETGCKTRKAGCEDGIDSEQIYQLLKMLMDRGLLGEILKNCGSLPYQCARHENGLKVVRGNTVKMDVFDTGDPNAKAYFQELVSKDESHISAGFLVIDHSEFPWELTYEEIDYVIEGTLTVTIDGKKYTANAGDVLFVPSGSKVIWGSPDKARVFYATYPANWADLL